MINTCLFGNAAEGLKSLKPDYMGKIQTCITSPPYFGLRDYGAEGQLGHENSVEEYIANLVEVFELVRDLLKDDGTLWLNLGDCYAGSGKGRNNDKAYAPVAGAQKRNKGSLAGKLKPTPLSGVLKPKDLIGVPWRVAFALQSRGWFLRQDIIWEKSNAMPEPVRDRCTRSHEYIFLLSKSKKYYFDNNAIKEPAAQLSNSKRNKRSVWKVANCSQPNSHHAVFPPSLIIPPILAGSKINDIVLDPFLGSGTTAAVAEKLGRRWLGCELNPDFEELQKAKIHNLKL